MPDRAIEILSELATAPSVPYHEIGVAGVVTRILRQIGCTPTADAFGNLIVSHRTGQPTTSLALVAHLDHPGIEITSIESERSATAALLGGLRPAYFDRPVSILIVGEGRPRRAAIVGYALDPVTGISSLQIEHGGDIAVGEWGVFDIPAFAEEDDELVMRAADDLVGVAAVLATLERVATSGVTTSIHAVFTRAEEIGLVGADLLAAEQTLPLDTIVISLECSAALPGAEPGLGPVIRVGDRTQAFHPDGEAVLLAARSRLPSTAIQRQLMSGGSCEATAFARRGYRTTGVAVPLVNMHNMGPDNRIVSERIRRGDFHGEIELLVAACAVAGDGVSSTGTESPSDAERMMRQRLVGSADAFRQFGENDGPNNV